MFRLSDISANMSSVNVLSRAHSGDKATGSDNGIEGPSHPGRISARSGRRPTNGTAKTTRMHPISEVKPMVTPEEKDALDAMSKDIRFNDEYKRKKSNGCNEEGKKSKYNKRISKEPPKKEMPPIYTQIHMKIENLPQVENINTFPNVLIEWQQTGPLMIKRVMTFEQYVEYLLQRIHQIEEPERQKKS